MKPTFDEFRRQIVASPAGKERVLQMQADVHEAVRATAVTGHKDWDHFVEQIEGRIKSCIEAAAAEQRVLNDPMLVNDEKIRACKVKIACLDAARSTLEDIVGLPKSIIERGARAADTLRALGGGTETPSEVSKT